MEPQSYKNHIRFYSPHHFIFYPLLLILIGLSIFFSIADVATRLLWIFLAIAFLLVACLSFMMRQHYALNNQNRIVRLEMRFRYYVLTGQRLEPLEKELSFSQIAALRFASDDELPVLIGRAIREKLSPKAIKRSVQQWMPDTMRV